MTTVASDVSASGRHVSPAHDAGARAVPSMVVAAGFSSDPMPLGLDRPFELRGAAALGVDALVPTLPLDPYPEIVSFAASACRRQVSAGRHWLSMPPALLLGYEAFEAEFLVRTLARHAGLPFLAVDVSPDRCGRSVSDGACASPPDVRLPSEPVLAMAATRCANPIVLLTGTELAAEDVLGRFAAMIDPATAERSVEPGIRLVADLGQVSWFIAAASERRLPPAIDAAAVRLVRSRRSGVEHARLLAACMVGEVMTDLGLKARDLPRGASDALETIAAAVAVAVARIPGDVAAMHACVVAELQLRVGR